MRIRKPTFLRGYQPPALSDHPVAAEVRTACLAIRRARPNSPFVKPEYRNPERPLQGCCCRATEASYHLIAGDYMDPTFLPTWHATGLVVMRGAYGPHWWLATRDGDVIELTDTDPNDGYPYNEGVAMSLRRDGQPHAKPFMTKHPSKYARWIIGLVDPSHPHADPPW